MKTAKTAYKIRFNPKTTVKAINSTLDAIDKCGGYCPCQVKSASTKCHCADFRNKKAIGEPCICEIYVKQAKNAKKKAVKTVKTVKAVKAKKAKKAKK